MEQQVQCLSCRHVRDFADPEHYSGGLKWCQVKTDRNPPVAEVVNPQQLRICREFDPHE